MLEKHLSLNSSFLHRKTLKVQGEDGRLCRQLCRSISVTRCQSATLIWPGEKATSIKSFCLHLQQAAYQYWSWSSVRIKQIFCEKRSIYSVFYFFKHLTPGQANSFGARSDFSFSNAFRHTKQLPRTSALLIQVTAFQKYLQEWEGWG